MRKQLSTKFKQPFIEQIDYMNCIPIYFEHKIPDAVSSFPHLIVQVVTDCTWDESHKARIEDGSGIDAPCVRPFYKIIDTNKGTDDAKFEAEFIQSIYKSCKVQIDRENA
jgi:hypothetical protein